MNKREASKVNAAAVSLPSHRRKTPISVCLMVVALLASLFVWPPGELSSVALTQEEGRQIELTIPSDVVNLHHNCGDDGTERARGYRTSFGIDYGITERTELRVYSTREADDCNSFSEGDIVIRAEAEIICWYRVTWVTFMPPDCNPPSYTLRSYIVGAHGDASADVDEYDISSYIYSMREGRISGLRDRFASCEYDPSSSTISIIDTSYSVTSACIIGGNEYYLGPIFQISPPKFRKSRITSKTNNLSPGKWWVKLCHGDEYPNYSDHCSDVEEATRTINFEAIKVVDNIYIRWHGVTSNPAGRAGFPNTVYLRDRHGIAELSCPATKTTLRAGYLNFICTGYTNKLDSDFIVIGPNSKYAARGGTISEREIPAVQVVRMEVTQGLQDWNNNITLVKGKRTAVRIFFEMTTDTQLEFSGFLLGKKIKEGSEKSLGTLISVNPGFSVTVGKDVEERRSNIDSSLNFILPLGWTDIKNDEELILEFKHFGSVPTRIRCEDAGNNRCIETILFTNITPPNLVFIPIAMTNELTPDTEDMLLTDMNLVHEAAARIESMMPFPSRDFSGNSDYIEILDTVLGPVTQTLTRDAPGRDDLDEANDELDDYRNDLGEEYNSPILLGLLPGPSNHSFGRSLPGRDAASWFVASSREYTYGHSRNTGAHELAHTLGRNHPGLEVVRNGEVDLIGVCGAPIPEGSEEYPYFHNFGTDNNENWRPTIGPLPHIDNKHDFNDEIWGLDIRYVDPQAEENYILQNSQIVATGISDDEHNFLSVINPYRIFSLMGYCRAFSNPASNLSQGRWIDEFNFGAILQDHITADADEEISGTSNDASISVSEYFRGGMLLSLDGSVVDISLAPVRPSFRGSLPVDASEGEYRFELRDSGGDVLWSVPFDVAESVEEADPDFAGEVSDTVYASFSLFVSDPPDYSKIAVTRSGVDLIVVERSANAPTLSLEGPVEGQRFAYDEPVPLSWTASDLDGDELQYKIFYSTDGGDSYRQISKPLSGTSTTYDRLNGSERARFAVSVSDGTRWAFAESPVFAVGNSPPMVDIKSPRESAVLAGLQGFLLDGWAYDREDKSLGSASFSWSSSIDGHLGTGSYLVMSAANLTAGDHRVTLTVTDSGGLTSTATTNFTISRTNQLPIANDDTARIALDETALLDVLANDTDIEGDTKDELMQIYDLPLLGTAEIINNQRNRAVIAYTAGGTGTDYFTYLICDGVDRCDIAQVTINITTDGCTILGTEEDDTLRGTSGNDVICGLGGNDMIYGSGGNDIIRAGRGDDTIYGQAGDDLIYGGFGNDNILGHRGDDTIYGGFGDEEIWGGGGDDTIWGGYGADDIRGEADDDTLYGEDGPDLIHGGRGDDTIYGGPGDDTIRGNEGADTIHPGLGNNTLLGTAPEDTIIRNFYGR